MDGAVTCPEGFRGSPTWGVGARAGHLLVETPIRSRRLPRLWQHSGAGRVLSWKSRTGTRLQPQCVGDGAALASPFGSGCRAPAAEVGGSLLNFSLFRFRNPLLSSV